MRGGGSDVITTLARGAQSHYTRNVRGYILGQALYRKYRSHGFEEVVGQRHVTDLLAAAIKNGMISHAYLFTGPRGTGKTSVARIVAHAVNDLPYDGDTTHLDIIEIDAASNRRIDDIRDLREKVHIAPTSARYKVYIIDEVHMLTGESFNALLKTLEEPPAHAIFILATTELHKVPATIVSRTQRFHFRPGSSAEVIAHLRMIADKESIAIDDDALSVIAEHSDGGFRDSVSLLDQVSSLDNAQITAEVVEGLLGLAPRQQVEQIVEAVATRDAAQAISLLQRLCDDGTGVITIINQLLPHLTHKAAEAPDLYPLLYELIEIPKSHAPLLKLIALIGTRHSNQRSQTKSPEAVRTSQTKSAAAESAPDSEPLPPSKTPMPAAAVPSQPPSDQPLDWQHVVTTLAARAPALHALVKRARVTVEPDAITLAFGFKLHAKQMQDDKHLSVLRSVISDLYQTSPAIVVSTATAALNDHAKTVAAIMGGGEAVKL